ncbi:hypothetical protein [Kocuria sp.]|uniref:hypothetical protein n=1 Tax=Kocuria sp. TaxID=1871328 RepID=UPI0028123694|nr:hypothetical protein [Kocuria sp.]
MPMTHYRRMADQQATAALEEFLAERAPALEALHAALRTEGMDPEVLLDASPESLTPLWAWITDHQAQLAANPSADSPVQPREQWPSWARHTVTSLKIPSATMFTLLDGLVSYLAQVLIIGAPTARWVVGSPQDPRHHLHHHPVLTGAGHEVFVPTLPMGGMLRLKRAEPSLRPTELAEYAAATVKNLSEAAPYRPPAPDPPVVVVAEPEGFDVGVRADIAGDHPQLVERMATALTTHHGVTAVERLGRDAMLVHARDGDADALQHRLTAWLNIHLPFDR